MLEMVKSSVRAAHRMARARMAYALYAVAVTGILAGFIFKDSHLRYLVT